MEALLNYESISDCVEYASEKAYESIANELFGTYIRYLVVILSIYGHGIRSTRRTDSTHKHTDIIEQSTPNIVVTKPYNMHRLYT